MRLSEIMKTDVKTVEPSTPALEAAAMMRFHGIHHLVVVRGGKVLGVISDRDLGGRFVSRMTEDCAVATVMTAFPCTAPPAMTVRDAANLMRGRSIGCLPILDRGRLVGIVTVSDLLALIGRGAERPVARTKRWTLRHRGNRPAWNKNSRRASAR